MQLRLAELLTHWRWNPGSSSSQSSSAASWWGPCSHPWRDHEAWAPPSCQTQAWRRGSWGGARWGDPQPSTGKCNYTLSNYHQTWCTQIFWGSIRLIIFNIQTHMKFVFLWIIHIKISDTFHSGNLQTFIIVTSRQKEHLPGKQLVRWCYIMVRRYGGPIRWRK